jgi:organic radical activating enzyme
MRKASLLVSEIFGPTVSGEGVTCGQRRAFIRLGLCNLHCAWCDTAYTWDDTRHNLEEELTLWPVEDIVSEVLTMDVPAVIISGGEPLIHQNKPGWSLLLYSLRKLGIGVEIETNGTITPNPVTISGTKLFTVSPKLAHAGDPEHRRLRPMVVKILAATGKAVFKFVCITSDDVAEVVGLVKDWDLDPSKVWIMPEGIDSPSLCDHLAVITPPAVAAGFNVTTRLHIHIWGNERGW